jgi:hypothetical protein
METGRDSKYFDMISDRYEEVYGEGYPPLNFRRLLNRIIRMACIGGIGSFGVNGSVKHA